MKTTAELGREYGIDPLEVRAAARLRRIVPARVGASLVLTAEQIASLEEDFRLLAADPPVAARTPASS